MADFTHEYPLILGAPYQNVDVPVGFPQLGGRPSLAGLVTIATATNGAQTVSLPAPCATDNLFTRIDIANLSAETVALVASYDGGNSFPDNPTVTTLSTGAIGTSTALTNGSYLLPPNVHFSDLKFTKSSSGNTVFIAVAWAAIPAQ